MKTETTDADGQTPIHIAIRVRAYDTLESLLSSGAEWRLADHNHLTPLALAAKLGDIRSLQLLLSTTTGIRKPRLGMPAISVNYWEKGGVTALHAASEEGRTAMIRELLRLGAYVRAVDDDGWTPLHFACQWNHVDAAQLLLGAGAQAWALSRSGASPLTSAAAYLATEAVDLLLRTLKNEFDPRDPSPDFLDRMPEILAAKRSQEFRAAVNQALSAAASGFDFSLIGPGPSGWKRKFLLSFRQRQPNVITMLLDAGANPDVKGTEGRSARDVAKANKCETALTLFGSPKENPASNREHA